MNSIICGVDKNGKVYPLGVKYDHGTGLASLAVSRGAGKNTFSQEYTAAQTNTVIITPGTAQKVCVASVFVCGNGTAGVVSLDFATSGKKVFRHYMTKYNQSFGSDMHIEGAANETLQLTTTTGADTVFVVVNYRLID
jgi:hypothetical protein